MRLPKRKLVTREKAKPTDRQHRAPCSDCPFRRDAPPGWLGGNTPETFVAIAHTDQKYNCHTKVGPQCAGLAIYRANVCKVPREEDVLRLPGNTEHVFSTDEEFLAHHRRGR